VSRRPIAAGPKAVEVVSALLERLAASVVDLDADIAVRAARLRARHRSLKLPGGLVLASAERSAADRLITTDRKWPTAKASK
jgi:predicted nucleic acid-binding protein